MALGQGYVAAFDNFINSLLIEPAGKALGGALSKLGGALGGDGAGAEAAQGSSEGFSMGSWLKGLKSDTPKIELTRTPETQIQTPAIQKDQYHVDMADIGSFSAPNFGGAMAKSAARAV